MNRRNSQKLDPAKISCHTAVDLVAAVRERPRGSRDLYPLSPNSDQHQISPHQISAFQHIQVIRIKQMITKSELSLKEHVLTTSTQQN